MWFKNIQFKLVNLSKCGRRQRKKERKKKGGYNTNWSVLAKEGNVRKRENEREKENSWSLTYFLLTGYVLEGSCILFQMFFPPPLQCKYEVFPFLCTLTRLFLFFFFYNNNCPSPSPPPTQLLPIILKLVKTLNNK